MRRHRGVAGPRSRSVDALTLQKQLPAERARVRRPRGWQWRQTWKDVLFLHWEVAGDRLHRLLPDHVELDRWDGSAWVSAVAFRLAKVQLGPLPPVPLCTNFLELNLRTYVLYRGEPGIYFLSMHADARVAVAAARWLTPLPYRHAPMACCSEQGQWRWQCGPSVAGRAALLNGRFQPQGEARPVAADSLDVWLLERYRAFVPDRQGTLYCMAVEHAPWDVCGSTAEIAQVSCEPSLGIDLSRTPCLSHFSDGVGAVVLPFERIA
jgi:uncharacterized protein